MIYRICFIVFTAMVLSFSQVTISAETNQDSHDGLTTFGSIQAGNEAGTIPAYTGGLDPTDPAYNEEPFPFASEKPRLVISAKNMAKYTDKLAPGTKALMKKFPSYHINVYPTHRTVSYPDWMLKHTAENATDSECRIVDHGLGLAKACRRGLPFPYPETGKQVLWDHLLPYYGMAYSNHSKGYFWSAGETIFTVASDYKQNNVYYAKNPPRPELYKTGKGVIVAPTRARGGMQLQWFYMRPSENGGKLKRSWLYQKGLRRVRRAPNASHDTPFAATGGNMVFSEQYLFSGLMDRFNYKLLGRKEMFIPYNNNKVTYHCSPDEAMKPHFVNPECLRWELHRVWVVKATLKPDKHSIYSKRMYYFDEDTYLGGLYAAWNQRGGLQRFGSLATLTLTRGGYGGTIPTLLTFYNYKTDSYFYLNIGLGFEMRDKLWPSSVFSPRTMRGMGVF